MLNSWRGVAIEPFDVLPFGGVACQAHRMVHRPIRIGDFVSAFAEPGPVVEKIANVDVAIAVLVAHVDGSIPEELDAGRIADFGGKIIG